MQTYIYVMTMGIAFGMGLGSVVFIIMWVIKKATEIIEQATK